MELTWTYDVFSRIAMVLFLCRNRSSRNDLKLQVRLFGNNKKYWQKIKARGPTPFPRVWGARLPPWAHSLPRGPPGAPPTSTPTPYIRIRGEKIREKDSSRFTIRSRRQALNSLGRADLESVRGSEERNPSPSSSSTFLHHQFHDAHHHA